MHSVKAAVLGAVMAVSVGAGTALAQNGSPVRQRRARSASRSARRRARQARDPIGPRETSAPTVATCAKTSRSGDYE